MSLILPACPTTKYYKVDLDVQIKQWSEREYDPYCKFISYKSGMLFEMALSLLEIV